MIERNPSGSAAIQADGDVAIAPAENPTFFSRVTDFERYLDVARNNKLAIAGVMAVALALGLVITMLTTPQYRATSRIEISLVEQNVTNVEGLQNEGLLADRAYLPTQYELLESRSLASRVVRELDLTNDDEFLEAFEINAVPDSDIENEVVSTLLSNITINPITNSLLVDISFSSPSPQISAKIANAWAEGYMAENLDRRFGATLEARDFLEERLAQTRDRLEEAERAVIAYASAQGLVSVVVPREDGDSAGTASQTLVASELAEFNRALQVASADRIAAEAALSSRDNSAAAAQDEIGSATVADLRSRRGALLAELADLRSRFAESYPPVEALRAQVAEIEQLIGEEQGAARGRLQADYREAVSREDRLRSRVAALEGQFLSQRQDSVEYNILQREVDTNRELYAGLLQRYREIGVVGVGESNILIVDEARVPGVPYKPNLFRNLFVAGLLGLIVIGLGLYASEMLNQSLRDPRQLKNRLGINLLASIPRTPEGELVEELSHSYSELYESYFSLTSSLAFSAGGAIPRSMMITSSRPGEGKSLTSVAVAYLLGRQGKRVLLIDCDLRKSGIAKYIQANNPVGISQYLQGDDDWRAMVTPPEPLEGFDVISAGRRPMSAAELLANGRFQQLLNEAESYYDVVVVDAPPVLGLVDSPLMASSLSGVLLVVEANEGKWRYIEAAIARLRQSNAEIIGGVVTKVDDRNAMYGYGDGYGYGYGAKESVQEQEAIA